MCFVDFCDRIVQRFANHCVADTRSLVSLHVARLRNEKSYFARRFWKTHMKANRPVRFVRFVLRASETHFLT
jgi:hypothetical protein